MTQVSSKNTFNEIQPSEVVVLSFVFLSYLKSFIFFQTAIDF